MKQIIQWQTVAAEPVTAGETTITPQSQILTIHFPFGGFIWQRPAAVLLQRGEHTERIAIVDVTRLAVWVLTGLSLTVTIAAWLAGRQSREN